MKHYFIVNPVAGSCNSEKYIPMIHECFKKCKDPYEIIVTSREHEATEIVENLAKSGEEIRVYAVGGDGTLFDIVNGAAMHKNVSIGIIPTGSGNDFVKSFGGKELFLDIDGQVNGSPVPLDLIKFEDKYSINISSLGMDAEVVNHHNRHRVLSKINGPFSYTFSVFTAFIFNMNNHFHIVADGEELDGTYLFVIIANGRYYGGGFNPTPYANMRDGVLDLLLINEVSRAKVVKLMQKYRTGEHLNIDGLCVRRDVKHVEVLMDKEMSVQLDGEIFRRKKAVFDVVHNGINFILPSLVNIKSAESSDKISPKSKLKKIVTAEKAKDEVKQ